MKFLQKYFFIYLIIFGWTGKFNAQNNRWVDMFSYLKIQHLQATTENIYAQSDNALISYQLNSGEIEKISSIHGLSGDKISNFYFDESLQKLFIFHDGGLIEIIDNQKNVFKSPELQYNTFIPSEKKVLNGFAVKEHLIYMATAYGISVYNLEKNEFGDTYYLDNGTNYQNVNDIAIQGDYIYAATNTGLKVANLQDNLLDFNAWQTALHFTFDQLLVFNNKLLGSRGQSIYEIHQNNKVKILHFNQAIRNLNSNNLLDVTFRHEAKSFNNSYILQHTYTDQSFQNESFNDLIDVGQEMFIASQKHGVLKTALNENNYTEIHPDCPISNHAFAIDAVNEHVWVVYGDYITTDNFNPFPVYKEGVSGYEKDHWVNIPFEELNITDISFVKINPQNLDEVYLSSKDGLMRIRNNQVDALFDYHNSPLTQHLDFTFVYAIGFDSKSNLWVTQRGRPALLKLDPNDNWESIHLQNILTNPEDIHGFGALKVDKNDKIWLGTIYKGVLGYNPDTQQAVALKNGIEPANYNIITALDIDKDNTMWVGNIFGLRTLYNPDKMFEDPSGMEFKPIKIVYEDAVQLLMEGQNITSIKVDGSNNKWISTLGSGVYYFSEDGTQTIYHFTKENSPLPSNDIYDVAIDGSNGMVYFASLNGMIGFKGNATEGGENMDDVYAFPNPANQKQHNFVTIRGLIEGVNIKIVDVAGNLVYETISKGGSVTWDLTAFGKYKVASGVYIALITNEDGTQTQTTKILVIK